MTHPNPCFDASTSSWNGLSRSGRRSAGADTMSDLSSSKAARAGADKPEKRAGADLPNSALSGVATAEKLGTYGRHEPARPRKASTSFCERGSGQSTTAAIEFGSRETVRPSTTRPRCFMRSYPSRHLRGVRRILQRRHVASTRRNWPRNSSQSSAPPEMSSMNTAHTSSAYSAANDSSMKRWYVPGALHSPNIITLGWNKPRCVTKAALARSDGGSGICQYPECASSPNSYRHPASRRSCASWSGIGYAALTVTRLSGT
mmetsp:Transcript_8975/g.37076  ORF Transcript_8975/g.37076 Transcript_8975/m.37076 type:complete len:260 (+) Transcript_8975:531-1310(+)